MESKAKEIELKFLVDEAFTRDHLLGDAHLREIAGEGKIEKIPMEAEYFDTPDRALLKKGIAFRVRQEGAHMVATLKWGGSAENGLHIRGELNVPVDEAFAQKPCMEIFRGSENYEEICQAVGDWPLEPVMRMSFLRQQLRVDTGKSICVVSYDEGEIQTICGSAPISELEIELYSGEQKDMLALGEELAQKYNLQAGNKSKYQRGLELLGVIK